MIGGPAWIRTGNQTVMSVVISQKYPIKSAFFAISDAVLACPCAGLLWDNCGGLQPSLDAHENGPRCAQISGPTVGARQRSLPSISWWQTRAWVIVLCQDRSRRRRWPKASLYKGLSPGPRSANRRPRWSVSSARMPKGDTPERTRLVGPKNEHTPGPFA